MNKRQERIPNNLKEYRLKTGLTQKQVCQRLGLSNEVSLSHWEKGKNIPNIINLFKLCTIYKIHPFKMYQKVGTDIKRNLMSSNINP